MHRLMKIAVIILACAVVSAVTVPSAPAAGLMIKKVTEVGEKVYLNDGSVWDVPNPRDWDVAYNWLPGQPVELLKDGEMLNTLNGERINVKRSKEETAPGGDGVPAYTGAGGGKPAVAPVLTHPALKPIGTGGGTDALTEQRLEKVESGLQSLENKLDILLQRMESIEKRLPKQ